jgi:ABC-2 type transport system permease protein
LTAAALAIVGAALNQSGAGLATDRALRQADPSVHPLLAGRIAERGIRAWIIAGTAIALALIVLIVFTPISISLGTWLLLGFLILIGSAPVLLGAMCIVFWARSEAARTIANIAFLFLSFGAGLVLPPWSLPRFVWQASVIFPSRHYADVAWAPALEWDFALENGAWLSLFTAVLGTGGLLGLRRAQRQLASAHD